MKKGFLKLNVVYTFILVNCYIIKSQYPIHSLKKTFNTAE